MLVTFKCPPRLAGQYSQPWMRANEWMHEIGGEFQRDVVLWEVSLPSTYVGRNIQGAWEAR